jgi:hypothetical protein
MSVYLDGPVGRRWNQVNVKNSDQDQRRVIALLHQIPSADGGKKDVWMGPILSGGDGNCSPYLL